jgi:predicted RNA polymerase sigma factor
MQRPSEAAAAYNRAIGLCEDAAMREFLRRRMQVCLDEKEPGD